MLGVDGSRLAVFRLAVSHLVAPIFRLTIFVSDAFHLLVGGQLVAVEMDGRGLGS